MPTTSSCPTADHIPVTRSPTRGPLHAAGRQGGSDAGISAALRARGLDPSVDVTVVVADPYPNFSICGSSSTWRWPGWPRCAAARAGCRYIAEASSRAGRRARRVVCRSAYPRCVLGRDGLAALPGQVGDLPAAFNRDPQAEVLAPSLRPAAPGTCRSSPKLRRCRHRRRRGRGVAGHARGLRETALPRRRPDGRSRRG